MNKTFFNKNSLNQNKLLQDAISKKNGKDKFDTCKYRSEEKIEKVIKRCACKGGNYKSAGYFCNKKNIFNINEEICNFCSEYINKNLIDPQ